VVKAVDADADERSAARGSSVVGDLGREVRLSGAIEPVKADQRARVGAYSLDLLPELRNDALSLVLLSFVLVALGRCGHACRLTIGGRR
jgi:hypothetical protein